MTCFASCRPGSGDLLIKIVLRPIAEAAVDEAKRMADAGQPRHGFGIGRTDFWLVLRDEIEHLPGLSPAKLKMY